jgi:hypothetical protein
MVNRLTSSKFPKIEALADYWTTITAGVLRSFLYSNLNSGNYLRKGSLLMGGGGNFINIKFLGKKLLMLTSGGYSRYLMWQFVCGELFLGFSSGFFRSYFAHFI